MFLLSFSGKDCYKTEELSFFLSQRILQIPVLNVSNNLLRIATESLIEFAFLDRSCSIYRIMFKGLLQQILISFDQHMKQTLFIG